MTSELRVRYADGAERVLPVRADETVLEAAEIHGVPIVSECQSGVCGTCVARCSNGTYAMPNVVGLSTNEKASGRILTCQTRVTSDATIELDYPLASNAAQILIGEATVARVERLSPEAALLVLDTSSLGETPSFRPGQFAQLRVPGSDAWRSYSYAHAPSSAPEISFLIRVLPSGVMSDWIRDRAKPGDRVGFRGSKGSFYLREGSRPLHLVAGGTGLSGLLAIAEEALRRNPSRPVRLDYGVRNAADLVLSARLDALAAAHPSFSWRGIVQSPSPDRSGRIGVVTDLLAEGSVDPECEVYACGPPPMIDATRRWLRENGRGHLALHYEKFLPSGARPVDETAPARPAIDLADVRARGRGTAVVVGGSIVGMAAAKMLLGSFERVIVLEKDQDHRKKEARPGAAQGWHLHHLLIAGQRELSAIFPGIIDDMVEAGAFKVDMGEQYRLLLAGSWKKPAPTGVEIVCAGRPLLEWCVRRRLDDVPAIDYRYESDLRDLVLDPATHSIVGVVVAHDGAEQVVPTEFVVDASGKNTPVPGLLERLGIGMPEVEEDCLNCFYSTMHHKVPPGRAWTDRVMMIAYSQRPQQQTYAASYYIDTTRTVLSTSLIQYNCYAPPRNEAEFREFAKLMPSSAIGAELEGLEACSPVYNFRYPEMRRYHYERMKDLPAGLIAVGDAFASADPVSGTGMTKGLLEVADLKKLLDTGRARDAALVHDYFVAVAARAEEVWSLVREQTLRFSWIQDVEKKRPFGFAFRNWYVDRVFELLHDDPDVYRLYQRVVHLVEPATSLMKPSFVARVIGHWLRTKLTKGKTLIERNFENGRMGEWHVTRL